MPVEKGNMAKVEYTGSLDDGTVFDSSDKHGGPLTFVVGAGQMIQGFDEAVLGMEKGEKKEFDLTPDQAYGDYDPRLKAKIPRDKLGPGIEPEIGHIYVLTLPDGLKVPAGVVEVSDKEVTLDMNHPLAGKGLHFKIKVVEYGENDGCGEGDCDCDCGHCH